MTGNRTKLLPMRFVTTLGFLFSSNFLVAVLSVFLGIATARLLGAEGRGEFYLFVQAVSLGTILVAFGIHSSFQYYLRKQLMSKSDIMGMVGFQLVLSTIILSVGLVLTKSYLREWFSFSDDSLYLMLVSMLLGLLVLYLNSIMMTFSRGVKATTRLAVVQSFLQLGLFLGFVFLLSDQTAATGYAVTAFILAVFIRALGSLGMVGDLKFSISKTFTSDLKELYVYGAASFLANISVILLFRVDTFMIQYFKGAEQLGIYSAAAAISEIVLLFSSAVGTALFAHIPKLELAERISLIKKTLLAISSLSAIAIVSLGVFGHIILYILFGEEFSEAIYPLLYLLPGLFFMSLNYCFANYFSGVGRPKITGYIFFLGVLTNVILNLYLIPDYGIAGAAIASSVAFFQVLLLFIWALKKLENINIQDLMTLSGDELNSIKNLVMSKWKDLF